jgi:hypothetical protein
MERADFPSEGSAPNDPRRASADTNADPSTSTNDYAGDGGTARLSDRVSRGMSATADWLRDRDLEGMRTGIERQVKEYPGRSLLIAAGLGYLLGRAMRK